mmetsp:Transcript_16231/g.63287  ORF Transcript_16231/g.63287 Transcript_16231/m.63287 type:complete len:1102 (-) Transcript_16231:25-3330(-)|eukprot:CAMPEP_0114604154 /NCGR_PEP_ID=MMETSP0168-20121206/400_1 /TAXON_ID=95228 ORGANISM="Vannella sp., Strain DIVA3 517/6/12" /NCGR_SAMPLE_ID=MMETSP0168 /ASSEMBLY_ACC=CAM_ASM_000044 /LENGTH=1101 /DNA_ID=CAMNT_0001814979 /DNA_START=26 /DNA_END=3331 /DNA_ORIENTATION=+
MESIEKIAEFLLEHGLYRTALEMHEEICLQGIDNVPVLSDYFLQDPSTVEDLPAFFSTANRKSRIKQAPSHSRKGSTAGEEEKGHRRTESGTDLQVAVDSLRAELKEKNERIQVAEYELRCSKEDVEALRSELKSVMEGGGGGGAFEGDEGEAAAHEKARELGEEGAIKVYERKCLNYLVKNYLVSRKHHLSAITLAEEVTDQDLNSWDEISFSRVEPPTLLELYRYFYGTGENVQLQKVEEEIVALRARNEELLLENGKLEDAMRTIGELQAEVEELKQVIAEGIPDRGLDDEELPEELEAEQQEGATEEEKAVEVEVAFRIAPLQLPEFRKVGAAWLEENARLYEAIEDVAVLGRRKNGPVLILGDSLENIIPSILLKSRKEILPLLLVTIQRHRDAKVRDRLTNVLFNLIKRPDEQQRQMIMSGCVALARLVGSDRTQMELLPQCWEQIGSKYEERRVLVAESCGALAAYVDGSMRVSLILSILAEQMEDKNDMVREAVVKNLAQLISYFDNDDKYSKVEEMVLKLYYDSNSSVVAAVHAVLVPVFIEWSVARGKLLSKVLPLFLGEVGKMMKHMDPARINEHNASRVEQLFDTLCALVRKMYEVVLVTSPFEAGPRATPAEKTEGERKKEEEGKRKEHSPETPGDDDDAEKEEEVVDDLSAKFGLTADPESVYDTQQVAALQRQFDEYLAGPRKARLAAAIKGAEKDSGDWTALAYVLEEFIPEFIRVVTAYEAAEAPRITNGLSVVLSTLCSEFGAVFTTHVVEPCFKDILSEDSTTLSTADLKATRGRLTPVYMVGALTVHGGTERVIAELKEMIVDIAEERNSWNKSFVQMLRDCITLLCTKDTLLPKIVTLVSRELIGHPAAKVRAQVMDLYNDIIPALYATDLEKALLPALVTLSSDVEATVRRATLRPLGALATALESKSQLETIGKQVEALLKGADHKTMCEMAAMFASVVPNTETYFRDACVLPCLIKLTDANSQSSSTSNKTELAKLLFDAYRSFNGCVITPETITRSIIPGLKLLQGDAAYLDPNYKNMLAKMIRDMEKAVSKGEHAGKAGTPKRSAGRGRGTPGRGSPAPEQGQGWRSVMRWGQNK